jgi:hypothetical protein
MKTILLLEPYAVIRLERSYLVPTYTIESQTYNMGKNKHVAEFYYLKYSQ